MRAVVFTEELMGVALKFSRKSTYVGSLLVSWDSSGQQQQQQQQQENGKSSGLATASSSKKQKSFVRRVRATISLCLAMFLVTLLVFALCALDASSSSSSAAPTPVQSRPVLQQQPRAAMGSLGVVFRRGTKSMSELVIAHVQSESASELRALALFIRTLHRSGVAARADVVILFPGDARAMGERIVVDEDARFRQTIAAANAPAASEPVSSSNCTISRMNLAAYHRAAAVAATGGGGNVTAAAAPPLEVAWGAILGFDVAELDPSDTLSGFIDKPPMQLRRWVCYQMLLGIARHRYKAAMVAQVRGVLVLGDGLLGLARRSSRDGRSLVVVEEDRTWLDDGGGGRRQRRRAGTIEAVYGKQVWASIERGDKAAWPMVSAAVIAGGGRGLRAVSEAVATEIARAAMLRRSRSAFPDSAALNYVLRRNAGALGQKVADRVNAVGRSTGGAAAVNVVRTVLPSWSTKVFQQEGTGDNYAVVVVVVDDQAAGSNSSSPLDRYLIDDLCSSPVERAIYDAECGVSSSRAPL